MLKNKNNYVNVGKEKATENSKVPTFVVKKNGVGGKVGRRET